jgi:hypothetical protein
MWEVWLQVVAVGGGRGVREFSSNSLFSWESKADSMGDWMRANAVVAIVLGSIPAFPYHSGIAETADEAVLNKAQKIQAKMAIQKLSLKRGEICEFSMSALFFGGGGALHI